MTNLDKIKSILNKLSHNISVCIHFTQDEYDEVMSMLIDNLNLLSDTRVKTEETRSKDKIEDMEKRKKQYEYSINRAKVYAQVMQEKANTAVEYAKDLKRELKQKLIRELENEE